MLREMTLKISHHPSGVVFVTSPESPGLHVCEKTLEKALAVVPCLLRELEAEKWPEAERSDDRGDTGKPALSPIRVLRDNQDPRKR